MSACGGSAHAAHGGRSSLSQGYPWRWLPAYGLALAAGLAQACDLLPLVPLAPGLWLAPGAGGDSDARNRGHTAHVLLADDGPGRLMAIGSGATPVLGARLRCTAQRQLGRTVHTVLLPLAVAELTLGSAGLAPRRLWAPAAVAAAMRVQCARCVDRLRQRLGAAAADLGDDPVRLPLARWHGAHFSAGPFEAWLLPRAADGWTTVLRHRASGVLFAPGLLWGDGPPDLRDTGLSVMQGSLRRVRDLGRPGTRWVGQAGPVLDRAAVQAQLDYVDRLADAAARGVRAGAVDPPAPALAGDAHPRHALNWQRAWRQAEDAWMSQR